MCHFTASTLAHAGCITLDSKVPRWCCSPSCLPALHWFKFLYRYDHPTIGVPLQTLLDIFMSWDFGIVNPISLLMFQVHPMICFSLEWQDQYVIHNYSDLPLNCHGSPLPAEVYIFKLGRTFGIWVCVDLLCASSVASADPSEFYGQAVQNRNASLPSSLLFLGGPLPALWQ